MTPAQHRAGEAFMHRGYFGLGQSQQQDAATIGNSLNQLSQAAMKTGDPIASAILQTGAALANIVMLVWTESEQHDYDRLGKPD